MASLVGFFDQNTLQSFQTEYRSYLQSPIPKGLPGNVDGVANLDLASAPRVDESARSVLQSPRMQGLQGAFDEIADLDLENGKDQTPDALPTQQEHLEIMLAELGLDDPSLFYGDASESPEKQSLEYRATDSAEFIENDASSQPIQNKKEVLIDKNAPQSDSEQWSLTSDDIVHYRDQHDPTLAREYTEYRNRLKALWGGTLPSLPPQ